MSENCTIGAEVFGDAYLADLRTYVEAFISEDKRRIHPAIEKVLARANSWQSSWISPS
jgi:hypothetical protein